MKTSAWLLVLGVAVIAAHSLVGPKTPEHVHTSAEAPPAATAGVAAVTPGQAAPGSSFEEVYALKGEHLRVVPPPFGSARAEFLKKQFPWPGEVEQIVAGKNGLIIDWKGGKPEFSSFISSNEYGFVPAELIQILLGYHRYDIDGDFRLISRPTPGDVAIDGEATREQLLGGFEKLFREKSNVDVTIREVDMDSPVLVLKGEWKFAAMAEGRSPFQKEGKPVVEVYGGDLDSPGRTSSVFERDAGGFGQQLSDVLGRVIAVEAKDAPSKISFHFNYSGDRTAEGARKAHDAELVLGHICDQTGLKLSTEVRKRRRLVIKDVPPGEPSLP